MGNNVVIEGQADNLESIYSFSRNLKNYDPESKISIQKLALATNSPMKVLSDEESFETESLLTPDSADFYEFVISDSSVSSSSKKAKTRKSSELPDARLLN